MNYIMKNGRDLKLNKFYKKNTFAVLIFLCIFVFLLSNNVFAKSNSKKATISFIGDISIKESTNIAAYKREGGIDNVVDRFYQNIFNNSDFLVANLEGCISDKGTPFDKQFTFRMKPSYTKILKNVGIDLVSLANNHSLDYGKDAFIDTIKNLDRYGIKYIGAGKNIKEANEPFIKEINGIRFAFFATTAVSPSGEWYAKEDDIGVSDGYIIENICDAIKKLKEKEKDIIVVAYMHWGREKEEVNNFQRNYAKSLVNAGCDLVVGSHPHVVQAIEYYKGVPIVYSLGNFIYGYTSTETISLDVIFEVDGDKNKTYIKITPGISSYEKVIPLGFQKERDEKVKSILRKSYACTLDEKGYIVELQ